MSTGPSFETDRARLVYLVHESVARIEEAEEGTLGDIWDLVAEIEDLELAQRMGFFTEPLLRIAHQSSPNRYYLVLVWAEPSGRKTGPCFVSTLDGEAPARRQTSDSWKTNREILMSCLVGWLRNLERLPTPTLYPADHALRPPGVDQRLWAIPLWRAFHRTIEIAREDPSRLFARDFHLPDTPNLERVNRLAKHEGLRAPFHVEIKKGVRKRLIVTSPDGDETTVVCPFPGQGPAVASSEALSVLASWQRVCEGAVEPTGDDEWPKPAPADHENDLALLSNLEEYIIDELSSSSGTRYQSSTDLAEGIQKRQSGKTPDERAIRATIARMRKRGWPIETTTAGSRIPPSKRDLLPEEFRRGSE